MPETRWLVLAGIGAAAAALAATIWYDSTRFIKVKYTIHSDKIRKGCKIVLLSDLHNKRFGKKNVRLLQAIDEEAPDMIVIAGDMMTANNERTSCLVPLELLERLTSRYPVYYGNGNHEYRMKIYKKEYGHMYEDYKRKLTGLGVHLLENERIYLPENNMEICGVEIEKYYYKRFYHRPMEDGYINSLIGSGREDRFEFLIAHNPDYFEKYAMWGADLTVSGHVHGGVMRLPVLGGVISPMMQLFPKYDGGLFEKGGRQMILSRGLGMHTIPVRVFNPGELIVIDLK